MFWDKTGPKSNSYSTPKQIRTPQQSVTNVKVSNSNSKTKYYIQESINYLANSSRKSDFEMLAYLNGKEAGNKNGNVSDTTSHLLGSQQSLLNLIANRKGVGQTSSEKTYLGASKLSNSNKLFEFSQSRTGFRL